MEHGACLVDFNHKKDDGWEGEGDRLGGAQPTMGTSRR